MDKNAQNGEICQRNSASGQRPQQRRGLTNEMRNQVLENAEAATSEINSTFAAFEKSMLDSIEKRKRELLKLVETIREDALAMLNGFSANAESQSRQPQNSKKSGASLKLGKDENGSDDGSISSLPELTIPSILVRFNSSAVQQCLVDVSGLGYVSYSDPIKIVESREKPGAVAIHWEESEGDFCSDDLESGQFRLQYCRGDFTASDSPPRETEFVDAYVGQDTCCVVRNLELHVDYSFRVCRIGSAANGESEWSRVHVAKTTVVPYEWDDSPGDEYTLTDERRIAIKESTRPFSVHSRGAQFGRGHSLQFAVLEGGSGGWDAEEQGLGLALEKLSGEGSPPARPGTIFVNREGSVFVNGTLTSTRLPEMLPGRTLIFESEEEGEAREGKMRVMITCEGKRVTYDWRVAVTRDRSRQDIHFFGYFKDKGWRVKVE